MALYSIKHRTHYKYYYPVSISHHAVFLEPKTVPGQNVLDFNLTGRPKIQDLRKRQDYFGNSFSLFSILEEHQELEIISTSRVEVTKQPVDISTLKMSCSAVRQAVASPGIPGDVRQFTFPSPRIPDAAEEILTYAAAIFQDDVSFARAALDFCAAVKRDFTFDAKATDIDTSVNRFFRLKRGVCQDFTHFMLTCIRSLGLPARYVSGYILTMPPPGQPRLEGSDASHAWVSIFIPDYGWLDLDPTNNLVVADQHVTVAWGRDFDDVSLVRGAVTGGGEHVLTVNVTMAPQEAE